MDRASKHSAIFITAYIATSVINYAFGVSLSWFFNPRQFGVLGVTQSLLLMFALIVGAGFTWTVARDFASTGNCETSRRRFRMALLANAILAVGLGISLWIAYRTGIMPLGPAYRVVIPLVGLTTLILSVRGVLNGAARGVFLFAPVAFNLIVEVVIKAAVGLLLVYLGLGVNGVILSFAIGAGLSLVHSLWVLQPARLWEGRGWLDRTVLKDTAPYFLSFMGIAILLNLDVLGLKILAPADSGDIQAGIYQAAVILARAPVFIAQALTLVLFSYAASSTRMRETRLESELTENRTDYVRTALKTWLRLILPGALVLILAPRPILALLFPPAYQSAASILQITAIGGAMLALATLLTGVFQALGQRRIPVRATGLAAITQVIVLIWLVPDQGAEGAALSLIAAGICATLTMLPLLLPILKDLYETNRVIPARFPTWLASLVLPHISLAAFLIFIPKGRVDLSLLLLIVAAMIYLGVLAILRTKTELNQKRSAIQKINQFVQVLLGG